MMYLIVRKTTRVYSGRQAKKRKSDKAPSYRRKASSSTGVIRQKRVLFSRHIHSIRSPCRTSVNPSVQPDEAGDAAFTAASCFQARNSAHSRYFRSGQHRTASISTPSSSARINSGRSASTRFLPHPAKSPAPPESGAKSFPPLPASAHSHQESADPTPTSQSAHY